MQKVNCMHQLSLGGTALKPDLEPGHLKTGQVHGTVQVPGGPGNQYSPPLIKASS